MQITGYRLFDPAQREPKVLLETNSIKDVWRAAKALVARVYAARKAAGQREPLVVCAIHREKGIHRWFNLAMEVRNGDEIVVPCAIEYAGALNHAEELLAGNWYIASPDEEAARKAADEKAARDAEDRTQRERDAGAERTGQAIARALAQFAQPAPAPEPVKEPEPAKGGKK